MPPCFPEALDVIFGHIESTFSPGQDERDSVCERIDPTSLIATIIAWLRHGCWPRNRLVVVIKQQHRLSQVWLSRGGSGRYRDGPLRPNRKRLSVSVCSSSHPSGASLKRGAPVILLTSSSRHTGLLPVPPHGFCIFLSSRDSPFSLCAGLTVGNRVWVAFGTSALGPQKYQISSVSAEFFGSQISLHPGLCDSCVRGRRAFA